jgi:hypothetical protein
VDRSQAVPSRLKNAAKKLNVRGRCKARGLTVPASPVAPLLALFRIGPEADFSRPRPGDRPPALNKRSRTPPAKFDAPTSLV